MCILPIPAAKSLVHVSAIHSIFFMMKIVGGGLRYLFIYKIRSLCNFVIIYAKSVIFFFFCIFNNSVNHYNILRFPDVYIGFFHWKSLKFKKWYCDGHADEFGC